MIIKEFTPDILIDNKKSVIIADYSCVDYRNDGNTIFDKVAEKYDIELYPVLMGMTPFLLDYLCRTYKDYVCYIDRSLMKYFD